MGSSARKKAEKKKDFQKQKLKVGKQKLKASNHTDTSFKSKGIVLREQSLAVNAPSTNAQVSHHLAHLSSRSEAQRRDSLAFLASQLRHRSTRTPLPQAPAALLATFLPLALDGSAPVRANLLPVLRAFRPEEVVGHAERVLLHARVGLTHLLPGVRETALDVLAWALDVLPEELVSSAGGWTKTLRHLAQLLGWPVTDASSTSGPTKLNTANISKLTVKGLGVIARYLDAGLQAALEPDEQMRAGLLFPLADDTTLHRLPRTANAYGYLGLFRAVQSDDNEAFQDRAERQAAFRRTLQGQFEAQLAKAKKEGGELGRAAATTAIAITDGMADYEES